MSRELYACMCSPWQVLTKGQTFEKDVSLFSPRRQPCASLTRLRVLFRRQRCRRQIEIEDAFARLGVQLPNELQEKVRSHLGSRAVRSPPEARVIRVPMPTFPPTAMVYSVPPEEPPSPQEPAENPLPDYISAAVMAKVNPTRLGPEGRLAHLQPLTAACLETSRDVLDRSARCHHLMSSGWAVAVPVHFLFLALFFLDRKIGMTIF